jgi:hypothetical protein
LPSRRARRFGSRATPQPAVSRQPRHSLFFRFLATFFSAVSAADSPASVRNPSPQATSTTLRLPNFLVIGAMKASTTAFYDLAGQHPQIWFATEKEPHYFISPFYGQPAVWEAYGRLFADAPATARAIGEASTGYAKLPHFGDTPQRIYDALGNIRLIYLVRDPVERTLSNFRHAYAAGSYPAQTTVAEALRHDPILIDGSCYARQIRAYANVFGTQALLPIVAERLHRHPARAMAAVEAHLGLDPLPSWDGRLAQANESSAAAKTLALDARLGTGWARKLRLLAPPGLRRTLKRLLPAPPPPPAATAADRAEILRRVADDLRDLVDLLGPAVAEWPSVALLGLQEAATRGGKEYRCAC